MLMSVRFIISLQLYLNWKLSTQSAAMGTSDLGVGCAGAHKTSSWWAAVAILEDSVAGLEEFPHSLVCCRRNLVSNIFCVKC